MKKPFAPPINFGNIPGELKVIPHYVLWKYKPTKDSWTKPPYHPDGYHANTTDPDTWSTYEDVKAAYEAGGWNGIGFVLTDAQGIVGIDLDDVLVDGQPSEKAARIIEAIDSYTEISPSGTGIRIFLRGTYHGANKKDVYTNRYLTITGHVYDGHNTINERSNEVNEVFGNVRSNAGDCTPITTEKKEGEREVPSASRKPGTVGLSDSRVLEKAGYFGGWKFDRLMAGNWRGYKSSSEGRFALYCMLTFYCDGFEQIARIFRRSGFYGHDPDKCDKHMEREIGKAMAGCRSHYGI